MSYLPQRSFSFQLSVEQPRVHDVSKTIAVYGRYSRARRRLFAHRLIELDEMPDGEKVAVSKALADVIDELLEQLDHAVGFVCPSCGAGYKENPGGELKPAEKQLGAI